MYNLVRNLNVKSQTWGKYHAGSTVVQTSWAPLVAGYSPACFRAGVRLDATLSGMRSYFQAVEEFVCGEVNKTHRECQRQGLRIASTNQNHDFNKILYTKFGWPFFSQVGPRVFHTSCSCWEPEPLNFVDRYHLALQFWDRWAPFAAAFSILPTLMGWRGTQWSQVGAHIIVNAVDLAGFLRWWWPNTSKYYEPSKWTYPFAMWPQRYKRCANNHGHLEVLWKDNQCILFLK